MKIKIEIAKISIMFLLILMALVFESTLGTIFGDNWWNAFSFVPMFWSGQTYEKIARGIK